VTQGHSGANNKWIGQSVDGWIRWCGSGGRFAADISFPHQLRMHRALEPCMADRVDR
jgi:hypothetical protein